MKRAKRNPCGMNEYKMTLGIDHVNIECEGKLEYYHSGDMLALETQWDDDEETVKEIDDVLLELDELLLKLNRLVNNGVDFDYEDAEYRRRKKAREENVLQNNQ